MDRFEYTMGNPQPMVARPDTEDRTDPVRDPRPYKSKLHIFYDSAPEFQQLIGAWIAARRCPIGLVDYLIENGFERQANAANWAASAPDRPTSPVEGLEELSGGAMPCSRDVMIMPRTNRHHPLYPDHYRAAFYWHGMAGDSSMYSFDYPGQHNVEGETREEAILNMLDSIRIPSFDPTLPSLLKQDSLLKREIHAKS